MKYKILKKQKIGKMCAVCGSENEFGLKSTFYELDDGQVLALCVPRQEHQSYPGRMHGGIAGAILDETIGRAIYIKDKNAWGVTIELKLRFHKPIPLDEELRAMGRITRDTRRIYEGEGEIFLSSGEIAVSATAKYFKVPLEANDHIEEQRNEIWETSTFVKEPVEIEI